MPLKPKQYKQLSWSQGFKIGQENDPKRNAKMLITTMVVNPLLCPTIPHDDDQQNIFANRMCKKVYHDVHINMLCHHTITMLSMWDQDQSI